MPLLFEDFANVFFINVSLLCNESAKWRAQRAHMPYMPYVLYVPYVSTRLTCSTWPRALRALRAHVPKYILQTGKLKNGNLYPYVFKGTEFNFGP